MAFHFQRVIPPKDENWDWVCWTIDPSVAASTYPDPAAVEEAGAPMYILTLGLMDTVFAQLSLTRQNIVSMSMRALRDTSAYQVLKSQS